MIHVFFLLATAVSAAPVEGGVQVVVFSEGADFASKFIEGQEFDIALNEMDSAYGCYDRVGVRNFNLNIPVQTLSIELMVRSAQDPGSSRVQRRLLSTSNRR